MKNNRNDEIDILKGIGIFLMVFDHVGWGSIIHTYIQSFHMPLFFIVSGFLWKDKYEISEKIHKRFKSLMVPYIFFGLIYLLIHIIINGVNYKVIMAIGLFPTDMQNMPYAPALWFLPCMFITDILYTMINKLIKNKKIVGIIVMIIAIVGGIYSSFDLPMLPFSMESVMTALLFYYFGDCLKVIIKNKERNILNFNIKYSLFLFMISVFFAFCNKCVDMRSSRYCIVPLYFFNGILGTVAYWNISNQVNQLCVKNNLMIYLKKTLQYLSVNAMVFVCMNQFFISIVSKCFEQFMLPNGTLFVFVEKIVIFIATMFLCTIVDRIISNSKLKFILGK